MSILDDHAMEWLIFYTFEIIVIFWGAAKFFGKKAIEHAFNEKLEKHKQELNLITEEAKFNYSRMSQDFGLWTVKRHEAYAKLYIAIAESISKVFHLRGLGSMPDFRRFNKDEIEEWLKNKNFLQEDINLVALQWTNNNDIALRELSRLDKMFNEQQAEIAYKNFNNVLVETQIYMSDEIYKKLKPLLSQTGRLLYSYRAAYYNEEKNKQENELHEEIGNSWNELATLMRNELSGGYFKENN